MTRPLFRDYATFVFSAPRLFTFWPQPCHLRIQRCLSLPLVSVSRSGIFHVLFPGKNQKKLISQETWFIGGESFDRSVPSNLKRFNVDTSTQHLRWCMSMWVTKWLARLERGSRPPICVCASFIFDHFPLSSPRTVYMPYHPTYIMACVCLSE